MSGCHAWRRYRRLGAEAWRSLIEVVPAMCRQWREGFEIVNEKGSEQMGR